MGHKKIMKVFIIMILAIFLLSSALVSIMYFFDMQSKTTEPSTQTGTTTSGAIAS